MTLTTAPTGAPADPPVVSARHVEDLLAFIGHTLRRLPRNSLVAVTLRGPSMRAVVRVDLPGHPATSTTPETGTGWGAESEERADHDETGPGHAPALRWAEAVAAAVRQDRGADACLVLALEPEAPDAPVHRLAAALRPALDAVGLPVTAAWLVREGWAHPWSGPGEGYGADVGSVRVGRPELSDVSLHLMAEGSVWGAAEDADPPALPEHEPDPWPAPEAQDAAAWRTWLAAWEDVLTGDGGPPGTLRLRALGAGLVHKAWRDELVLVAARGAREDGAPPGSRTGAETVYLAQGGPRPRWDRMDRLRSTLHRIVPLAPDPQAVECLAVLGWLWWAGGRGSAAARHLDLALAVDPWHTLARLLRALVDSGRIAGWAVAPHTARRRRDESAR